MYVCMAIHIEIIGHINPWREQTVLGHITMHRVICPIGHIIPEQIVREGSWGRDSLLQMGTAYSRVNGPGGHFTSRLL